MIASLGKLAALLTRRDRRLAFVLLALMIIGALLEVVGVAAVPAFVSTVVDRASLDRLPLAREVFDWMGLVEERDLVLWAAFALLVVFAVKNTFLVFSFYWQIRFVRNRRIELSRRLMNAYMRAPYTFHLSRNTAELLRNIDREVTIIANQVMTPLLEIATRTLMLVGILAFLFVAEPWITLCWFAAFAVIGALGILAISSKLKLYGMEEQRQKKEFVQSLYQGLGCIKEILILNRESFFAGKVVDSVRRMANVVAFKQFAAKAIPPVTEFAALASLLGLAVVLIFLGRPTETILVTISLFVIALVRLRETIGAAMSHFATLRYSIVSVDPVHHDLELLEGPNQESSPLHERPPAPRHMRQQLELRSIWYRYEGSAGYALRDVDLTIPAGSAVGFVGSTGAGKSTLVDVILGLLKPEKGGVYVDGVEIHEHGVAAWQTTIGYVPQSIYLLDDTIRRNIALGIPDEEIDERTLRTAVRAAQLEDFVKRQPHGLKTVVGEQGVRLSGGERQRIGIARALYHDPDMLVLDEATSSLDTATEGAVISAVEALKGRRTILMIAHRLSTVRNCDTLYFLKDGRIEAKGDYTALQTHHPEFRIMAST